jgi:hypothetical protein
MKRTMTYVAAALLALGLLAGPAAAHHEHTVHLPSGNAVTLPCEPEHLATAVHPIHHGLHTALDLRARPGWEANHGGLHPAGITISTTPGACPTE